MMQLPIKPDSDYAEKLLNHLKEVRGLAGDLKETDK